MEARKVKRLYLGNILLNKIDKERLHEGKNGSYLNIVIKEWDGDDDFGNQITIEQQLTKEELADGHPHITLGSAKKFGDYSNSVDDLIT